MCTAVVNGGRTTPRDRSGGKRGTEFCADDGRGRRWSVFAGRRGHRVRVDAVRRRRPRNVRGPALVAAAAGRAIVADRRRFPGLGRGLLVRLLRRDRRRRRQQRREILARRGEVRSNARLA